MLFYRLYHMNRVTGHIDRVEEVAAQDDVRAVAIARERDRDAAVELWHEGRKVLRLEKPAGRFAPAGTQRLRSAIAG